MKKPKRLKEITICPKCYSSNYYISNNDGLITGQPGMYVCNNCGFEGVIFPQMSLDEIHELKKTDKFDAPKKIKLKEKKLNKINLVKLLIVLLFIFLTYMAYRFGLFDFVQSTHEHAINFFSKYMHLK